MNEADVVTSRTGGVIGPVLGAPAAPKRLPVMSLRMLPFLLVTVPLT